MATKNQATGLYEARKLLRWCGQEVIGTGETKEEAIAQMKEDLKAVREGLRKKEFLVKTPRNTWARPDLELAIREQLEKENKHEETN